MNILLNQTKDQAQLRQQVDMLTILRINNTKIAHDRVSIVQNCQFPIVVTIGSYKYTDIAGLADYFKKLYAQPVFDEDTVQRQQIADIQGTDQFTPGTAEDYKQPITTAATAPNPLQSSSATTTPVTQKQPLAPIQEEQFDLERFMTDNVKFSD